MRPTLHPSSFPLVRLLLLAGLLAACGVPDSGALPITPIANSTTLPLSADARTDSANPNDLTDVDGTLYFTTYGPGGYKLWKSDGTADGTALAVDLFPGEMDWYPAALTNVGGTLFFVTYSNQRDHQVWRLDETTTNRLDNTPPFYQRVSMDGKLFFFGGQGQSWELWQSDGATATQITTAPFGSSFYPFDIATSSQMIFFVVGDGIVGYELWRSDGTANGTAMVKGGQGWTLRANLTDVNGTLFFSAADANNGLELWKIDGATGEPALVIDLVPGPRSSNPSTLLNMDGALFFAAYTGGEGWELWKSDGTANGTTMIKGGLGATPVPYLAHIGGTLFFNAYDGASGWELWKSDGTAEGTVLVKDINPGSPDSQPEQLTSVGGTLFFTAYTEGYGRELWKSDGTAEGTALVADLNLKPGPALTPGPMPTPSIGFIP